MASFVRSRTFTVSDTVTSATLHDLIEGCSISGISAADIGGVYFASVTSATPNPSLAPFWYDTDTFDPVFRVFAAPWNIWLTVGPDRFEIPLKNSSGTECAKGCLVVASGISDFTIAANPSINAIGFLQSTTPAGSYGPVATMGYGWGLQGTGNSGGTVVDPLRALIARGTRPGSCTALDVTGIAGSGPMFGMWLESDRSGASGAGSAKRIFIWGPKITTGL